MSDNGVFSKQKDSVLEVKEALTLFTLVFQRQNQRLYDIINSQSSSKSVLTDQSTSLSVNVNSQQNALALMN